MSSFLKTVGVNTLWLGSNGLFYLGKNTVRAGQALEQTGIFLTRLSRSEIFFPYVMERFLLSAAEMHCVLTKRSSAATTVNALYWGEKYLINLSSPKIEITSNVTEEHLKQIPSRGKALIYAISDLALSTIASVVALLSCFLYVPGRVVQGLGSNKAWHNIPPFAGLQWLGNRAIKAVTEDTDSTSGIKVTEPEKPSQPSIKAVTEDTDSTSGIKVTEPEKPSQPSIKAVTEDTDSTSGIKVNGKKSRRRHKKSTDGDNPPSSASSSSNKPNTLAPESEDPNWSTVGPREGHKRKRKKQTEAPTPKGTPPTQGIPVSKPKVEATKVKKTQNPVSPSKPSADAVKPEAPTPKGTPPTTQDTPVSKPKVKATEGKKPQNLLSPSKPNAKVVKTKETISTTTPTTSQNRELPPVPPRPVQPSPQGTTNNIPAPPPPPPPQGMPIRPKQDTMVTAKGVSAAPQPATATPESALPSEQDFQGTVADVFQNSKQVTGMIDRAALDLTLAARRAAVDPPSENEDDSAWWSDGENL